MDMLAYDHGPPHGFATFFDNGRESFQEAGAVLPCLFLVGRAPISQNI